MKPDTTEHILSSFTYIKFLSRKNWSMVGKKVTTWLPMGFMDRAGLGEGGRELSGLSENTLYLDMGLG